MTKRRILAMIIALIMCVSLSACSGDESGVDDVQGETKVEIEPDKQVEVEVQAQAGRLILIYECRIVCEECVQKGIGDINYRWDEEDTLCEFGCTVSAPTQYIMYDSENMIMYTFVDDYRSGGLVMMVNPDGTPKLYCPNDETN